MLLNKKKLLLLILPIVSLAILAKVFWNSQILGIGVYGLSLAQHIEEFLLISLLYYSLMLDFGVVKDNPKSTQKQRIYGFGICLLISFINDTKLFSILITSLLLLSIIEIKKQHLSKLFLAIKLILIVLYFISSSIALFQDVLMHLCCFLVAFFCISVIDSKEHLKRNILISTVTTFVLFCIILLMNIESDYRYFLVFMFAILSLLIRLIGESSIYKIAIYANLLPIFFMILNIPLLINTQSEINFENLKYLTPNIAQLNIWLVVFLTLIQNVLIQRDHKLTVNSEIV